MHIAAPMLKIGPHDACVFVAAATLRRKPQIANIFRSALQFAHIIITVPDGAHNLESLSSGSWSVFHVLHSHRVAPNPKEQNASQALNGLTQSSLNAFLLDDQHSLRMDSQPAFLPNDSSKKRLMEDTEDWKPRTGTTQSRSFRILAQLTGTDFMQDPDDEHMKRVREKFITELQSPRYTRLRDWHHERSACSLNVKP
ncbi:unnamed protein product [Ranitomeya imitator]|uniref:Uncharacterized protein n=1 Tax=Ranitomeya imitator TaxID=111125 RepID=A0ABN9LMC0_9NEOB|nr:unnamed protein product [Ranitomeya imitator]